MSEISHDLEFQRKDGKELGPKAREMADCYAQTFSTPAGKRVLADLLIKCDPEQPRFSHESPNAVRGARIEGRCDVWREISNAILMGGGKAVLQAVKNNL